MTETVMTKRIEDLYAAFNARDASFVINQMSEDVRWPRAFEGDFVTGRAAVADYWTHQWQEIDPNVEPVSITQMDDGRFDVEIHQIVKDLEGTLLFDGTVHHFYTFDGDLISAMEVDVLKTDLGLS